MAGEMEFVREQIQALERERDAAVLKLEEAHETIEALLESQTEMKHPPLYVHNLEWALDSANEQVKRFRRFREDDHNRFMLLKTERDELRKDLAHARELLGPNPGFETFRAGKQ